MLVPEAGALGQAGQRVEHADVQLGAGVAAEVVVDHGDGVAAGGEVHGAGPAEVAVAAEDDDVGHGGCSLKVVDQALRGGAALSRARRAGWARAAAHLRAGGCSAAGSRSARPARGRARCRNGRGCRRWRRRCLGSRSRWVA